MRVFQRATGVAIMSLGACAGLSLLPCLAREALAAPRLAAVTGITGAGTGRGDARLWAELGFYDRDALTSISSELGFGLLLSPRFELEGILPFAYANTPDPDVPAGIVVLGDDDDGFEIGNPYIGINLFDERLRWSLGVGLPVAADGYTPLGAAWFTRGLQDPHLWLPDTLSFVGRLRAEAGNDVTLAFDGAAIVAVPTGDDDGRDVEIFLQPAGELIVRVARPTSFGARLSLQWAVTGDGDRAQLALAPFLQQDFGASYLNLQLLMNLDEPLGFAFDEGRYWGLFVGFGSGF
jgi:hypothetical protein